MANVNEKQKRRSFVPRFTKLKEKFERNPKGEVPTTATVFDFTEEAKIAIGEAEKNVAQAEVVGSGYIRENSRRSSRRRSMDVYKKAISSGATQQSATQLVRQFDPEFNVETYSKDADEPDDEDVKDFSGWTGSGKITAQFQNRWADYGKKSEDKATESCPTGLVGISI